MATIGTFKKTGSNEVTGEIVTLSVQAKGVRIVPDTRSTGENAPSHRVLVTEQDIIDWCHENMAVYKAPRVVQFVEALPKSGTGKVMWRQLQEAEKAPRAAPID